MGTLKMGDSYTVDDSDEKELSDEEIIEETEAKETPEEGEEKETPEDSSTSKEPATEDASTEDATSQKSDEDDSVTDSEIAGLTETKKKLSEELVELRRERRALREEKPLLVQK